MAQLVTVRLNKSNQEPLGFRLQGGKDFGVPLAVQKVNGGSPAERAGLQAGDALIRVNSTDVYTLRHQEAQDAIRLSGPTLELTVQRGGGTWRPTVTPTGSLPRPGSRLAATPTPVTATSLKATPQQNRAFGSGHNNVAKPFGYMNGSDNVKSIVNKQYNTPVNMYSDATIAETLSAQTEVLAGGVLGVNFKKNEKTYDAEKSAVFKVLQEEQNDPEPEVGAPSAVPANTGLRHVSAPVTRPDAPINNTGGLPPGQNICEDCERLITGVFVRIKDKNLHVECFKCATCGSSLKNQGYYNLNGKLYCDIHAKLVARTNPPAANLEPVTVPPGGRIPTNAYSTPLPPLSTNNYTNGSSSMFSPSSNLSGPKPFGSSIGSAYSPSLSPRSAPMSPARPAVAPVSAPAYAPAPAPAYAPAPAPAAPFAPTNETPNTSSPTKPEIKSQAEERLIKKIAKMALNGYEIGIQRKIKPADHIQSMADRIQDTVVTKHPFNAESISSNDSSREGTLRRAAGKPGDRFKTADSIQSIGNKIKEAILSNHPVTANLTNGPVPPPIPNSPVPTLKSYSTPVPPPLPNTPAPLLQDSVPSIPPPIPETPVPTFKVNSKSIVPPPLPDAPFPTFKAQNTTLSHALGNGNNALGNGNTKRPEIPKDFASDFSQVPEISNIVNKMSTSNENGYTSNDDQNKDHKTEHSFKDTLRKNNLFEKPLIYTESQIPKWETNTDIKVNNNYSNTMNKINLFEKRDTPNGTKNTILEEINKYVPEKSNSFLNHSVIDTENDNKVPIKEDRGMHPILPNNLHDNSLYQFKPMKVNGTTNGNESLNGDDINDKKTNTSDLVNEPEPEVLVKRREKKIDRNSDGRRDSHIIARPLSTMTSVDVTDGLYPVCHKCDKAITRGPFITALGRIWCPEHFICVNATCQRQLQDIGFVEENGQLYCEFCFEQYIAPACDKCHAKIKGDCLNAIGKHFHPECFNCVYCGKLFGNNPFFLEDGLPYCEADWNELFTTKCFACGFPVEAGDRWVEALNNNYHSQCFNCTVCKKNLEGQSFFAKGGRPFCKMHAR